MKCIAPVRNGKAKIFLLALIAVGLILGQPLLSGLKGARAQEIREHRSIIDLLFHGGPPREKPQVMRKAPRKKKIVRQHAPDRKGRMDAPVAKLADARKILVVGDFMASALADGLQMAFATEPGLEIEKRTDGSSGLVRTDHLDWPNMLGDYIEEVKPALVVVMLGANDRQQISTPDSKEKFRSEAWNNEYEKRINALIAVAASHKVPLLWTGLPAFQSPSLSTDAATLNSLYRGKVELAGGPFVDIWDGFADENGKFAASGSDINGQPVRLRGSDGLSLTKAGKRKMAFYLEKSIRALSGLGTAPALLRLDASNLPLDKAGSPTIANIQSVPPISLADPELDGTSVLLDSGLLPKSSGTSPRDLLIENGQTGVAPEGRADDYRWKPAPKPAG